MAKTLIKEICKQKGVKQIELARLLDMREDSFSTAIKRDTLSIEKLEIIAKYLGVELGDLFGKVVVCPHCGKELNIKVE